MRFPCLDEGSTPSSSTYASPRPVFLPKTGLFLSINEMTEPVRMFWKRDEMQWFVIRVKFTPVERIEQMLREDGIETFVPRRYELRRDAYGRKHRVFKNVLPEFVFVYQTYLYLQSFVKTVQVKHGLSVYFAKLRDGLQNRIMVVPDYQMRPFMKAINEMSERVTFLQPDEVALRRGDRVRVHGGPLDGCVGEVMRVKGKRKKQLVLHIVDFAAISVTTVEPEYLEIIGDDEPPSNPNKP